MRVILFFDLPMDTKKQIRVYTKFRTYLIRQGYIMLQYSVYSKILNNVDSANQHIKMIERSIPQEGNIRILLLTEKQYARMKIIIGGKSRMEQIITIEPFVHL